MKNFYTTNFIILFSAFIIFFSFFLLFELNNANDISNPNFKDYSLIENDKISYLNISDKIKVYTKNNIKIKFVERLLSSGTKFYFINIENLTENDFEFQYIINIDSIKQYKFDKDKYAKGFSSLVGYDNTTSPSLYVEALDKSILIGKSYNYTILSKKYDDIHYSYLNNLISESDDVKVNNNNIIITMNLKPNSYLDTYFYTSNNNLFENEDSITEYENCIKNRETAVWNTYKGKVSKIQYSIEPYTTEGYTINIGALLEKSLMMSDDKSILFNDLMESSVMSLMSYNLKNSDNIFYSTYTSTWIKKPYGIIAPYIDTRHNENIGKILSTYGQLIGNNDLKNFYENYSNFLLNKYQKGEYLKFDDNFLFYDYYTISESIETHASLNHQVAIANYLLNTYLNTGKDKYLNLAQKLLSSIKFIGNKWIRDNGDLWYRINPDGTFEGTDYVTVTLEDLLLSQDYLYKIVGKYDDTLNLLIKSKVKYLQKNNINISSKILDNYKKVCDE